MKLIAALLLVFCSIYGYARNTVFAKLCNVNRCWQDQKDIDDRMLPATMPEDDREQIRIHLQLVERILRTRSTSHLSSIQKQNRGQALDELHAYWQAGKFPINDKYAKRTPIFIDKYDNFCAVGYLVKATGYEHVSRIIAANTNLAYVHEMNYPELTEWAGNYGFTIDELAWIQPGYNPKQFATSMGKGTNGTVYELYADDTAGKLYVGGNFTKADVVLDVKNIAYVTESNGAFNWHTMNGGPHGTVYAIAGFDNKIFAGGDFKMATGTMATGIAYWDGNKWNGIAPSCLDGIVKDLVVYHGKLYAAGNFKVGAADVCLALWTGYCWFPYTGISGIANTMEVFNDKLVLGGKFSYNGNKVNAIAWDDISSFQPFSNSIVSEVNDFEVYKNQLFAACTPTGSEQQLVQKLQGNNWQIDTVQLYIWGSFAIHSLITYDDTLMIGGQFESPSSVHVENCVTIKPKPLYPWMQYNNWFLVDSTIYKLARFKNMIVAGGAFKYGYGMLNSVARKSYCEPPQAIQTTIEDKAAKQITCHYTVQQYSYLPDSVKWDFGDGEIQMKYGPDTVVMHTYKTSGQFYVCATAFSVCGTNKWCDSVDLLPVTGVQEYTINGMKPYPNPAKDHFRVDGAPYGTNAILVDLSGRIVSEQLLRDAKTAIDVRALQPGYYLLQLNTPDGRRQTLKLTKE